MREMHIGCTGTREGMNEYQKDGVTQFVSTLVSTFKPDNIQIYLHHGDCRGVDVETAQIAYDLGCKIICHPPKNKRYRGFFQHNEFTTKEKDYFVRDKEIVDLSQLLIVVPKHMEWQPRGGTWFTHDYAKSKDVFMRIFWPQRKVG